MFHWQTDSAANEPLNSILLLGHKNTDNFVSIFSSSLSCRPALLLLLLLSISSCVQTAMEVLPCEYRQVCSAAVCSQLAHTDKVQGLGELCCCSCQFIYLRCDKAGQPQWARTVVGQFSPFRKSKLAFCVGNENNISQRFLWTDRVKKKVKCVDVLNTCRENQLCFVLEFCCLPNEEATSPLTLHLIPLLFNSNE